MHASQNAEYQKFVPAFVSLLREAMQLRGRGLEDGDYYDEAKRIKNEMLKMINAQAKDPGLQKYQDIFRRHPERIFQWAENRSVPAENNMSERGVRRTVIARKVCVRWTRASASLTCSSRCRHTRQNSVGDGRGPVAFRRAGKSRICLSVDGKHLKVDCGFGLDDSKSSDALLLRCSDAEVGQDRASGVDRPSTGRALRERRKSAIIHIL